jgi:hypothetical protein
MRAGAFLSHQRININTLDSKKEGKEGKEGKCALPPIFTLLLVCQSVQSSTILLSVFCTVINQDSIRDARPETGQLMN